MFKQAGEKKKGLWRRVVDLALTDVRVAVGGVDHESLESLEERLLAADFGVAATMRLVDHVDSLARRGKVSGGAELRQALKEEIAKILEPAGSSFLQMAETGRTVYLIVGVNGVGKTTSVAKLAHRIRSEGRSVMIAAADTFRAGAVEQLRVWAERVGADFVAGQQELEKVDRVIRRRCEGAPHECLIVLDATVGQNAVSQVRTFGEAVDLSGIILTKLDGTARGGIVVGLQQEFGLPVKLVGSGEGIEDLSDFDPDDFVEGVFKG